MEKREDPQFRKKLTRDYRVSAKVSGKSRVPFATFRKMNDSS